MPKQTKMKPKNRVSRKKPTSTFKRFSVSSFSLTRALMFVMAFAIIGTWYLIATKAAATPQVRFVLFCTEKCSGSVGELDSYANEIQNWYKAQTGKTFQRLPTIKFQGRNYSSYYNSNGSNNTDYAYYRIYDEPGLLEANVKTVVMLGFRAMNNCGVGQGLLALTDPFKGCSNIKSAVLAHELGHTLLSGSDSDHTSDRTLMHQPLACAGNPLRNCNMNANHRSRIAASPWLNPPAAPKATVQGIKSVGTGNGQSTSPELNPVDIVYLDGAGWGSNRDADRHKGIGEGWYSYANIPQGYHRFGVDKIPAGWEIIGYTVCYDRTDCHAQNPQAMQPNPLSHYHGAPSVVINTQGKKYADLWFHFRKKEVAQPPAPQNDDTFLKINVAGAPANAVTLQSGPNNLPNRTHPAHDIGRCGKSFTVNNNSSRTCTGFQIGPISISAQTFSGYQVKWENCTGGTSPSGNSCWMNFYGSGTKEITLRYVKTGTSSPSTPSSSGGGSAGGPFSVTFYDYYTRVTKTGARVNTINASWKGSPISGIGADYFHAIFQGTFRAPASGTYTFYSEEDDGFALGINNTFVIDRWNKPARTAQGSINLTANQSYKFAAAVYDLTGPSHVRVYWSGPGINGKQLFPNR